MMNGQLCRAAIVGGVLSALILTGCQGPNSGTNNGSSSTQSLTASTPEAAQLATEPGLTVKVVSPVDVSASVPQGGASAASIALNPDDVSVGNAPAKSRPTLQSIDGNMTVSFAVSSADESDACTAGLSAA
ncbi:MAG: hypothetical protein ACE5GE_09695, partial [Phycisphaerae bacterium]